MNYRERIYKTFKREQIDRVVWQPRLEQWYKSRKADNLLPEQYRNMTILELYKDLGCSIRPYEFYQKCIVESPGPNVKVQREETGDTMIVTWDTPLGSLCRVWKFSHGWLTREFPIKKLEDIKVMEYILKEKRVDYNKQEFDIAEETIGELSAPMVWTYQSPLMRLFLEFMGFENTIYALHDHPGEIKNFMNLIEECDDAFFEAILASPVHFVDIGENLDQGLVSPGLFEEYILPRYKKRTAQLRSAGKYSFTHWDGKLRNLLLYAKETGLDGIEAVTPAPQGDIELEEIAQILSDDFILLDILPAILFLENVSYAELEQYTLKVLNLFAPNIILGISDEISPIGDIEKVRFISKLVSEYQIHY